MPSASMAMPPATHWHVMRTVGPSAVLSISRFPPAYVPWPGIRHQMRRPLSIGPSVSPSPGNCLTTFFAVLVRSLHLHFIPCWGSPKKIVAFGPNAASCNDRPFLPETAPNPLFSEIMPCPLSVTAIFPKVRSPMVRIYQGDEYIFFLPALSISLGRTSNPRLSVLHSGVNQYWRGPPVG